MRPAFLTFLLLFGSAGAMGQNIFSEEDTRIFYGGIHLGANFSQVDGDGFSGYHKVGVTGGGSVFVRIKSLLGLSLGLGYAQKGSHEARITETSIGPAVFRYRAHLEYAEVPFQVHLFTGRRMNYSAGISYSRLISSTETSESIYPIRISPELYPFRKQDWFWTAGLLYRVYGRWFLNGQYQYTLGSIRSEPQIPPGYGAGRQRNNVVTLRLLYIIGSGVRR